jgi:hypothetical protein
LSSNGDSGSTVGVGVGVAVGVGVVLAEVVLLGSSVASALLPPHAEAVRATASSTALRVVVRRREDVLTRCSCPWTARTRPRPLRPRACARGLPVRRGRETPVTAFPRIRDVLSGI